MGQVKRRADNLFGAKTMFQAARIVGRAIARVQKVDGESLSAGERCLRRELHFCRPDRQGEAASLPDLCGRQFHRGDADTPFFQIGEHKYGKPILDRVAQMT